MCKDDMLKHLSIPDISPLYNIQIVYPQTCLFITKNVTCSSSYETFQGCVPLVMPPSDKPQTLRSKKRMEKDYTTQWLASRFGLRLHQVFSLR